MSESPANASESPRGQARGGPRGRPRGRGGPRNRGMRGGRGGPRGRARGRGMRGGRGGPRGGASPSSSPAKTPAATTIPAATTTPVPTPAPEPVKTAVVTETISSPSTKKKGGLADRWQQQMAQQKEDDFQKNRDKLRGRRRGGVKFMDDQIRNLITEMKRLSAGPGKGLASLTYGTLFENTIDSMPALSATLQVAKKRDVVDYEGDMLMQGVHMGVLITLLKDTIEDTPDFQSVIGIRPITVDNSAAPGFSNAICAECSKTVYPMDRICANDKVMHKNCFRCCECKTSLKLANFAYNGGKFFCETHYQQKYRQGTSYDF